MPGRGVTLQSDASEKLSFPLAAELGEIFTRLLSAEGATCDRYARSGCVRHGIEARLPVHSAQANSRYVIRLDFVPFRFQARFRSLLD